MADPTQPFFGRVQPHPVAWAQLLGSVMYAPEAYDAPLPAESAPLWLYCSPRYAGQLIGCCVGESGANGPQCQVRTPHPVLVDSKPLPGIDFSPLWVYWIARQYSSMHNRPLYGDGAIVSDAALAISQWGLIPYDAWPATPANYQNYSDGPAPPAAKLAAKTPITIEGAPQVLQSFDQILAAIASEKPVWIGCPWRGGTTTAPDGRFSWTNSVIGGHAVILVGYSKPTDRIWIKNSWDNAKWGVQPKDATQPRGWGYCELSRMAADFTPAMFQSGQVEAIVLPRILWGPTPPPVPPTPPTPPDPTPTPTPPAPTPSYSSPIFVDAAGQRWQQQWIRA